MSRRGVRPQRPAPHGGDGRADRRGAGVRRGAGRARRDGPGRRTAAASPPRRRCAGRATRGRRSSSTCPCTAAAARRRPSRPGARRWPAGSSTPTAGPSSSPGSSPAAPPSRPRSTSARSRRPESQVGASPGYDAALRDGPGLVRETRITAYGTPWTVRTVAPEGFTPASYAAAPWILLGGSLFMTALTAFVLRMLLTARRRAERAVAATTKTLRDNEERFRALADSSPTGVFFADDAGEPRVLEPAPRRDRRRADARRRQPARPRRTPTTGERLDTAWGRAVADRSLFRGTYRVVRPDGSLRWVDLAAGPTRDEAGHVTGWVGSADDVTDTGRVAAPYRPADPHPRAHDRPRDADRPGRRGRVGERRGATVHAQRRRRAAPARRPRRAGRAGVLRRRRAARAAPRRAVERRAVAARPGRRGAALSPS